MTEDSDPEPGGLEEGPFDIDRRSHRRVSLDASVTIRSTAEASSSEGLAGLSEQAEFTVVGRGEDISVGGMYLIAEQRLPAGSTVEIEFKLPDQETEFDLTGEVRWTRRVTRDDGSHDWAIGLEFEEVQEPGRSILDNFVLDRLSE